MDPLKTSRTNSEILEIEIENRKVNCQTSSLAVFTPTKSLKEQYLGNYTTLNGSAIFLCYFATLPRGGSSERTEIAANDRSFQFHMLKLSFSSD